MPGLATRVNEATVGLVSRGVHEAAALSAQIVYLPHVQGYLGGNPAHYTADCIRWAVGPCQFQHLLGRELFEEFEGILVHGTSIGTEYFQFGYRPRP